MDAPAVRRPASRTRRHALSVVDVLRSTAAQLRDQAIALAAAPRELRLTYVMKWLVSYGYFSTSLMLTLLLSEDFGLSDSTAGWYYGAFGTLTSIYGFMMGFVIDNLGVRLSLLVGACFLLVGRTLLATTSSVESVQLALFVLLPLGEALGVPVLGLGIKRYTTDSNRATAYGVFYAFMNIGALFSGILIDLIRALVPPNGVPAFGFLWSVNRCVLLSGAFLQILMLPIGLWIREIDVLEHAEESKQHSSHGGGRSTAIDYAPVEAADNVETSHSFAADCENVRVDEVSSIATDHNNAQTAATTPVIKKFAPKRGTPWQIVAETARTKRFWRYFLLTIVLINIKQIFRHLDATLPKWMVRTFGPDAPFGLFYSVNPGMIIIGAPLVMALTQTQDVFKMLQLGTSIAGLSPFWVWLLPNYAGVFLFVFTLSCGEMIYSPRLQEYSMMVAPKGREGTYAALSAAPMFTAKFFVGGISGTLLQAYCPEYPCPDGKTVWLVVGLLCASSPVFLLLCSSLVRQPPGDLVERTSHQRQGAETEEQNIVNEKQGLNPNCISDGVRSGENESTVEVSED